MTPTAIIALVRDVVILVALGFLIYLLVSYGKDLVKVSDMRAVELQLDNNTQTEAQWRKEQADADAQHDLDIAAITASVGANQHPLYVVRGSPSACPVPANPTEAHGARPGSGGSDQGPGVNLRPRINAFELKYETAFAECRAAINGWPR